MTLSLLGCGPDQRPCAGGEPNFKVVLKLSGRALPPDTVVHVTYGGSGMEDYRLTAPNSLRQEVIFCSAADEAGEPLDASAAAAGASGDEPSPPLALFCKLYTGGFTTLEVSGTGIETTSHELAPRGRECPVKRTIILDAPDAG